MGKIDNAFTKQGTVTGASSALTEQLFNSAFGALSPLNNFGRYLTGSRCIIKVNNKLFGFAFKASYNISTLQEEIWTIDDWTPWELAPQRVMVTGTLGMFHIPGKGPAKELVQPNVLSFLHHKYITIEIRDHMTDQVIFKTNKAVITNKSQTIEAGTLSTIELQWKAVGWFDEMQPNFPVGHDTSDGGVEQVGKGNFLDNAVGAALDSFGF